MKARECYCDSRHGCIRPNDPVCPNDWRAQYRIETQAAEAIHSMNTTVLRAILAGAVDLTGIIRNELATRPMLDSERSK